MLIPIAAAIEEIRMSRFDDVRELVREHSAELTLVEDLQDALRHRDRGVARGCGPVAKAFGCCISRDEDLRHRHLPLCGELTNDPVELRVCSCSVTGFERVVAIAILSEYQYIAKLKTSPIPRTIRRRCWPPCS